MSIEQTETVDLVTIEQASGDACLVISDHLSWDDDEDQHLYLLQEKLNAYLRFIEGGEIFETCPETMGRSLVIEVAGKHPLSERALHFLEKAAAVVRDAGAKLRFQHMADIKD